MSAAGAPKKGAGKLLAFLLGCCLLLLVLLALEMACGLLVRGPGEPYPAARAPFRDPLLRYDPILMWRLNPGMSRGLYATSSMGTRGDGYPADGGGARFRVLCLGSSSTWGDGVSNDETYARVLAKKLSEKRPDVTFTVINAGLPGYSTQQSLLLERELLAAHAFDAVVIDNLVCDMELAARQDKEYRRPDSFAWLYRLVGRSTTYRFLRGALLGRDRAGPPPRESLVSRVSLDDYRRNLRDMVQEARAHKARVVMVVPLPYNRELIESMKPPPGPVRPEGRLNREMHLLFPHDREILLRTKALEPSYEEELRRTASSLGAELVDLPLLISGTPPSRSPYRDHCHPSAAGHALIASSLCERLAGVVDERLPARQGQDGTPPPAKSPSDGSPSEKPLR